MLELARAQWLREGATRYLAGDYAGALDRLDDGTVEGPAQLHAYLFRAAAQHALYVRSGEKDTVRRDQAIADVKRCKELEPTFAPDTRAFSPDVPRVLPAGRCRAAVRRPHAVGSPPCLPASRRDGQR